MCSGRVGSSCSTSGTCRVTFVLVLNIHEMFDTGPKATNNHSINWVDSALLKCGRSWFRSTVGSIQRLLKCIVATSQK